MKQQRYSKRVIIPLVASAAAAVVVASSSSELQSNDSGGIYDDNIPAERHRLREHRQQTNEIQDNLDMSPSSSSLVSLAAEPHHHHHRERKHNQARLLLKGQMPDTIQGESRALYQQKRKGHIPGINKIKSLHIASRASDLNVGDITAVRNNKTKKKNSSTATNAIQARQGHKRGVNAKKKGGKQRQQNQGGHQRNKTIQRNNKKPKPVNRGGGTQRDKKNMKDNNTRYGGGMKEEEEEEEVNEERLYREQVKNKMKDRMKNKKMKEQQQETTDDDSEDDDYSSTGWDASVSWSWRAAGGGKSGKKGHSGGGSWHREWIPTWPNEEPELCPCSETEEEKPPTSSSMTWYSHPLHPVLSGGKANRDENGKRRLWKPTGPRWQSQKQNSPVHNGMKAIKYDDWAPSYGEYGWSPGWGNVPGYAGTPHTTDWATPSWNEWDRSSGWGWNPTWAPTMCPCPTKSPTKIDMIQTNIPTYSPTIGTPSPTVLVEACPWFYWGADEGRGEPLGKNTETPEFQGEDNEVVDLSAGSRHTFIIDKNGKAYVSGFIESFYSYVGHLGVDRSLLNEGPNDFQIIDRVIDGGGNLIQPPNFMKVYAGAGAPGDSRNMHSLLIDAGGNVYTTGNNNKGQLCQGDTEDRDIFTKVNGLPPAVSAAVGLDFTLILLSDGTVYGCGSNENGEIGLGPDVAYTTTPNNGNGLSNIVEVSAGLNFALYLQKGFGDAEGTVFGSGSNLFSQLCQSTEGDPVDMPMELIVSGVSSIMAGRESSYYLFPNGSVKSCGRNDEGQLADGTFVDSDEPGKSAFVLFCLVLLCVQYKDSMIWLLHLTFFSLHLTAFTPHALTYVATSLSS